MSGGSEDVDPKAWIRLIGEPMRSEVEGLKRGFWVFSGALFGAGLIFGLILPYVLKKLGLG